MKKLIAFFVLGISIASFAVVTSSGLKPTGESKYDKVHTYLRENVYPELNELANYNPKKSFSRCPSGFAHNLDDEKSNDIWAQGTVFFRQGCDSKVFCFFKMNMNTEKVFLKKEKENRYASVEQFVATHSEDTAKI